MRCSKAGGLFPPAPSKAVFYIISEKGFLFDAKSFHFEKIQGIQENLLIKIAEYCELFLVIDMFIHISTSTNQLSVSFPMLSSPVLIRNTESFPNKQESFPKGKLSPPFRKPHPGIQNKNPGAPGTGDIFPYKQLLHQPLNPG